MSSGRRFPASIADRFRVDPRVALARRFGVDTRALAAVRVAVGALLLADLASRARFLTAFYTDWGVLPRAALRESYPGLARLSLHTVAGTTTGQALLFVIAALAALSLLVGYRTTLATAVSLVLLVSLHARNPLVLNGGDALLRRLLLWGLFLPIGEVWSVDALRAGETTARGSRRTFHGSAPPDPDDARSTGSGDRGTTARWVASLATAGLLCQVVVVYVANAAFKLRSDVWTEGGALRYVFSLDRVTLPLGDVLAGYPELLGVLEVVWLTMLVGSVGLVVLTGRYRAGLAALFASAHLGMALTMRIGLFPLISIVALLPFLPPGVWDRVERWVDGVGIRLDGVIRSVDAHVGGDGRVVPGGIVGRVDRAWAAPPVARWRKRVASVVLAALLVFLLVWNGATLGYVDLPSGVESVADPDERGWFMFADPYRADGWYVVPGRTESGREVDAMHGGPPTFERPPDVSSMYPDDRWRMYLVDLRQPSLAGLRPALAEGLCRRWNRTHDDDLRRLTVYYVKQPTRLDGPDPIRRVHVLDHTCSG